MHVISPEERKATVGRICRKDHFEICIETVHVFKKFFYMSLS